MYGLGCILTPPSFPSFVYVFLLVADGPNFSSKSMGLKIQKKVLGKLSTKGMAKQFIDDDFGKLLDVLNSILREEMEDNKKADKVIKNMIKIVVKIGLLYKNRQFNENELEIGAKLRVKLRKAAMTVISFYEVDFTYDRAFLVETVNDCGKLLHKLVERHLSEKSHGRINMVITNFSNPDILDKVFLRDGCQHHHLKTIAECFHKVVDAEW